MVYNKKGEVTNGADKIARNIFNRLCMADA